MSPSFAASLKQARHIPKSRMNERFRPQRKQRRTTREANFGVRFERATVDFLAILYENEPSKGSKEYTRRSLISQIRGKAGTGPASNYSSRGMTLWSLARKLP